MTRSLDSLPLRVVSIAGLCVAVSVAIAGTQALAGRALTVVTPDAVRWTANPHLPGVASANVVGDPTRRGLYVTLGKMHRGARFPPHEHPDARITTVISGTMYYGTGAVFVPGRLRAHPAGSIVETPPGVVHYMAAKDETTIMQETGFGPTGLTFSSPRSLPSDLNERSIR